MRVGSIIGVSLSDVPGIPVTVLFTGGCNFDCPYCHNSDLIPLGSGTAVPIEDIVDRMRGHMTDGYCITGGEPTIHTDLPELLSALRVEEQKHMNLNTQGSVPNVLRQCLTELDSVWFDMKGSSSRYMSVTGTKTDPWPRVRESIRLVMNSDAAFWPRTTYAGGLMTLDDIRDILVLLHELGFEGEYVLQNYVPSSGVRSDRAAALQYPDKGDVMDVLREVPDGISVRLEWR